MEEFVATFDLMLIFSSLIHQLKAMKLKEIAEDIKNQRQKQKNDVKGKKVLPDQANLAGSLLGQIDASSNTYDQEKLDEM